MRTAFRLELQRTWKKSRVYLGSSCWCQLRGNRTVEVECEFQQQSRGSLDGVPRTKGPFAKKAHGIFSETLYPKPQSLNPETLKAAPKLEDVSFSSEAPPSCWAASSHCSGRCGCLDSLGCRSQGGSRPFSSGHLRQVGASETGRLIRLIIGPKD